MSQTYDLPSGYLDPDGLIILAQTAMQDGEMETAIACGLTAMTMIINKWRTGNWINRDLEPLEPREGTIVADGTYYCRLCVDWHKLGQHRGFPS